MHHYITTSLHHRIKTKEEPGCDVFQKKKEKLRGEKRKGNRGVGYSKMKEKLGGDKTKENQAVG